MILINGKTETDYNANFIHWECTAPEPQLELATVPQRDGKINLTPTLSDEIHFDSRTLTIELELRSLRGEWPMYWSRMLRDLHGQEVTVARSDDPNWFYVGIASVGALEEHGATAGVTITVEAQPFKRSANFVEVIDVTVAGDETYTIDNIYMRGYPVFEASAAGMTVSLNGDTWTLPVGESEAYGMYFSEGENELAFHGTGTVRISWRGGIL